jgi:cytoskeletal protein CcmA (bactofilin family)
MSAAVFPHPSNWIALLTGLVLSLVSAVPAGAGEERAWLTGTFADEQFLAGPEVEVGDATLSDLFAAGGELRLDRLTAEDLFAAGGSIRLRDVAVERLVAAGGEIDLAGEVRDQLIAAGGRLRLRPEATVAGYALLAGGDIEIEGRIGGDLKAAGGRIRLSGEVDGDVDLAGGRITIEPGTRIGGKLIYRSGKEARIAPDAVIEGGVERVEREFPGLSLVAGIGIAIGIWLVVVLGLGAIGAVLHGVMPGLLTEAVRTLAARPWAALGLGFAVVVAPPVAANLLFLTLVGIPLALFTLGLYGVLLTVGLVTAAYWIGLRLGGIFDWAYEGEPVPWRILWTFLGFFVLGLLLLVPLLGFLVVLLALALGLGAFVLNAWHAIRGQEGRLTGPLV